MRLLVLTALAATTLAAEPGFESLFDGKTLSGWSVLPRKNAEGSWVVENGALRPEGKPGSLASEREYGDFDLRLEWKIAKLGNSGVYYRGGGDNPTATAIEYQLADNARPPSQQYPDRRCGAAYGLYAPSKDATRPVGQWNTARIVAKGSHVQHWLNGVKIADFDTESEEFRIRLAASKFSKEPAFARARSGKIILQDHASAVWFKNIRIRSPIMSPERQ